MIKYWNCLVSKQTAMGPNFFSLLLLNTQKNNYFSFLIRGFHLMRTSNSSTSQKGIVMWERKCCGMLCAQSPIYIHLQQQKRGLMIRDRKKIIFFCFHNMNRSSMRFLSIWDIFSVLCYVACHTLLSHFLSLTPTHSNDDTIYELHTSAHWNNTTEFIR